MSKVSNRTDMGISHRSSGKTVKVTTYNKTVTVTHTNNHNIGFVSTIGITIALTTTNTAHGTRDLTK